MWQLTPFVSVIFGRGGPIIGKLLRIKLVGMGEEIICLRDWIDLLFCNLVHMLEFLDVALELRSVGRARGRVFG